MALGLGLALIAAQVLRFPTREKVDRWNQRQAELIRQEREFGD